MIFPGCLGRVHIEPRDRLKVAEELVSRKICRWINLEEVHVVGGKKFLNGLFGVAKPATLKDQRPRLRVIMNLVASNSRDSPVTGGRGQIAGHHGLAKPGPGRRRKTSHLAKRHV